MALSSWPVVSTAPNIAAAAILAGSTVIDVRSAERHALDGLPGSVSLPLQRIEAGEVPAGVGRQERFYLVCEVGGFSELAAALLRSEGFEGASSVRGGLAALRPLLEGGPDV